MRYLPSLSTLVASLSQYASLTAVQDTYPSSYVCSMGHEPCQEPPSLQQLKSSPQMGHDLSLAVCRYSSHASQPSSHERVLGHVPSQAPCSPQQLSASPHLGQLSPLIGGNAFLSIAAARSNIRCPSHAARPSSCVRSSGKIACATHVSAQAPLGPQQFPSSPHLGQLSLAATFLASAVAFLSAAFFLSFAACSCRNVSHAARPSSHEICSGHWPAQAPPVPQQLKFSPQLKSGQASGATPSDFANLAGLANLAGSCNSGLSSV